MKPLLFSFLPGLLMSAGVAAAQPPANDQSSAAEARRDDEGTQPADPATPSKKIDETLGAIRGVEELQKLQKDVNALRALNQQLAADLAKQADKSNASIESLRAAITKQTADHKRLLEEAQASFLQQAAKQQQALEKKLADQSAEQKQRFDKLNANLDDLNTRLSAVPPLKLQALINDGENGGMAILELNGDTRLVRQGESFSLLPDAGNDTVRAVYVKEITDTGVLLQVGPYRHPVIIR